MRNNMKYIIKFVKNNEVVGQSSFNTHEEARAWKNIIIAKNRWGLPNTYSIIEETLEPSYSELRKAQYVLRIDPKLSEAITDQASGDNTAMRALLEEKALIKQEIPKPE